jgi:hypothetical protein
VHFAIKQKHIVQGCLCLEKKDGNYLSFFCFEMDSFDHQSSVDVLIKRISMWKE